jgi:hypothetical protein
MLLYHYTSKRHMPSISADGFIDTTESNVSLTREHGGPDVVWLTSCDAPTLNHGLRGSIFDKTEVRITVDVPNDWVKRWRKWAPIQGASALDMEMLAETGGGWEAADTWYVTTQPIPRKYWTEIAVKE